MQSANSSQHTFPTTHFTPAPQAKFQEVFTTLKEFQQDTSHQIRRMTSSANMYAGGGLFAAFGGKVANAYDAIDPVSVRENDGRLLRGELKVGSRITVPGIGEGPVWSSLASRCVLPHLSAPATSTPARLRAAKSLCATRDCGASENGAVMHPGIQSTPSLRRPDTHLSVYFRRP